jgi:hypothetical protein
MSRHIADPAIAPLAGRTLGELGWAPTGAPVLSVTEHSSYWDAFKIMSEHVSTLRQR